MNSISFEKISNREIGRSCNLSVGCMIEPIPGFFSRHHTKKRFTESGRTWLVKQWFTRGRSQLSSVESGRCLSISTVIPEGPGALFLPIWLCVVLPL